MGHITHPNEMAGTLPSVINKRQADTAYQRLFREAYGHEKITSERILNALTQFVLKLVSANSKYVRVKSGETSFNSWEQNGYTVFQAKCASCHVELLFTDYSYRNIGLPVYPFLRDYGRMRVTGNPIDSLKFRVPSLRNVAATSYYTHDGRFNMFVNVIEHSERLHAQFSIALLSYATPFVE